MLFKTLLLIITALLLTSCSTSFQLSVGKYSAVVGASVEVFEEPVAVDAQTSVFEPSFVEGFFNRLNRHYYLNLALHRTAI